MTRQDRARRRVPLLHRPLLAQYGRRHRHYRRAGLNTWAATRAATGDVLPGPVVAAVRLEWGMWRGLVRGLLRRPDIPLGASAFTHHRALAPVRWTIIAVLVIEVAVVHILVPSGIVQWVLLILGLYSLIWVLGYLLGSGIVRPHVVSARGLVLRCGLTIDITVPVDLIAHARVVRRLRAGTATIQVDDNVLSLVDNGGTTVDIDLTAPMLVPFPRGRSTHITGIRVWVDEPAAMADCIRRLSAPTRHLSDGAPAGEVSRSEQEQVRQPVARAGH